MNTQEVIGSLKLPDMRKRLTRSNVEWILAVIPLSGTQESILRTWLSSQR